MSIELLKKLVELVPERDAAQMVVDFASLPTERIDFAGPSKTMWHKILREAERHKDGVQRIVDTVLEDFPEDEFLIAFKNGTSQTHNTNSSDPKSQSTSSDQIDKMELKALVADDKIMAVIKMLSGAKDLLDSNQQNQLILFQARYSKLKNDNLNAIIGKDDFNLELNKLRVSLLDIIDTINI